MTDGKQVNELVMTEGGRNVYDQADAWMDEGRRADEMNEQWCIKGRMEYVHVDNDNIVAHLDVLEVKVWRWVRRWAFTSDTNKIQSLCFKLSTCIYYSTVHKNIQE